MRHIRRVRGEEPWTWVEFLELDDDGMAVRQIVCSRPPWPGGSAAKYSREYRKDQWGELTGEPLKESCLSVSSISPARFNFLWVAMRGSNPAAYGLWEWEGDGHPPAVSSLPSLLLAEFRHGTEGWDRQREVYREIEKMGELIGELGPGEEWTDLADGEYRTARFWTLTPLLYYAWHARHPGRFPREWPFTEDE